MKEKIYISVRNKLTDLENEFLVTEGKWGGGIDREFETGHVHTVVFKTDN